MSLQEENILIVDDNKSILSALEILLATQFGRSKTEYNLVILDMNFKAGVNTGNEGLYWLGRIKEDWPDISVVMITAYGDIDLAVKALKAGASDFVLKPWDNQKLLATVELALELNLSKRETEARDK